MWALGKIWSVSFCLHQSTDYHFLLQSSLLALVELWPPLSRSKEILITRKLALSLGGSDGKKIASDRSEIKKWLKNGL